MKARKEVKLVIKEDTWEHKSKPYRKPCRSSNIVLLRLKRSKEKGEKKKHLLLGTWIVMINSS